MNIPLSEKKVIKATKIAKKSKTNSVTKKSDEIIHNERLMSSLNSLEKELKHIRQNRFFKIYSNPWRLVLYQLLKGIAFGFGSVVGASIIVSFVIYLLSQIEFLPIIGEYIKVILDELRIKYQ